MGNTSRWLDVEVGADDTNLNTLPSNVVTVDLQNDNEFKLLIGDLGRGDEPSKLKVYKGAIQTADMVLPDVPLGVVGFYSSDTVPPSFPNIAVGFSSCVYIYRNMKLFYKYYLPTLELNTVEMDIWKQLIDTKNHELKIISSLTDNLKSMPYQYLSSQSQRFLSLNPEQQLEYLQQSPKPLVHKLAEVTCLATLRMNSVERFAVSCLIVGTEDGDVIVLDPQTFTQLHQAKLENNKVPFQMVTTGLYQVDYRIVVATREKSVCLLKREWKEGRILFNTDEHIIAIEVMTADNSVMVICTDNTMTCYSRKGKKQWQIQLEHRPVSMTSLGVMHLGAVLTGVALASGHLQLYHGKARQDTVFIRDVASVVKFGQLGQEEHVLMIVTASGNLMLKILKRTADFNSPAAGAEAARGAGRPWLIPNKSKLFLEQAKRERDSAIQMHEKFQGELARLRLTAAKALLDAYSKSDNNIGKGALEPIRLSAEVEGLGPVFRVTLTVQNTAADRAVVGLAILFHVHNAAYKVHNPYIKIPLLSPSSSLHFPTKVEEIFEGDFHPDVLFRSVSGQGGARSLVKILLLKDGRSSPALAATLQMPPTDPLMLPQPITDDTHNFA
ncbi:Bardet-Biedl syndrome 1 protein homolog [Plutella xylostella]|uniref:Bardet-Biedl syndrome 1 protein homolog n=1 Tax=Plutella xylostella TaxID=51655 RepID=UPI002032EB81|nr:Bardet-Biedl syndrome 1 protein homolog [Plutella xylostella]